MGASREVDPAVRGWGIHTVCCVCCFTAAYYANPEIGSRDEKSRVKRERIERAKRKEE
jgi:hypothetical protein